MTDPNTTTPQSGDQDYVAPRNTVESAIVAIWAELLTVERVGIHDNFLLLGGESLLATQAASRIRAMFYYDMPLRSILVNTVAEVATEVVANRGPATTG